MLFVKLARSCVYDVRGLVGRGRMGGGCVEAVLGSFMFFFFLAN